MGWVLEACSRGPCPDRRRAEADLAKLSAASQGHDTWEQQLRSLQETAEHLDEQAQRENPVASGAEQYELQRMAHKTDDSDSENEGDADDGYEDPYADIDVKAFVKQLEEQQAKNIIPKPPPADPNDANVQFACFRPTNETPKALGAILLARADPNLGVGEGIIATTRSHHPLFPTGDASTTPRSSVSPLRLASGRASAIAPCTALGSPCLHSAAASFDPATILPPPHWPSALGC